VYQQHHHQGQKYKSHHQGQQSNRQKHCQKNQNCHLRCPSPVGGALLGEEGTLTFIVTPDSTGINRIGLNLSIVYTCGDKQVTGPHVLMGDPDDPYDQICPITDGQFTIDWSTGLVIQGQFDETGTHASGTWEVSSKGTTCLVVTWQASPD